MEMDLDPRVKLLPYKVKAMSRESPAAKGANVLDPDLRTHWSTGTNTKEWILLELDESCLLSNVRIYNKSVLEWEITVGLRYKPESFVKVRPRCEAPKRDMSYPTNYTPCRYVRLSCLRGNPIAVFFIQLIGVSVKGLEPELQPVINYVLPHILSHRQDANDMHLQLLQDIAGRLLVFLPQLETELTTFTETPDSNIRFLAMLAGPFYPILQIINEREALKGSVISSDPEVSRNSQPSTVTVSSNFESRRSRNQSMFIQPGSCSIAFRPDATILLLRRAFKDKPLGVLCRSAALALQKIIDPIITQVQPTPNSDSASSAEFDETTVPLMLMPFHAHTADYSILFGEEFKVPNVDWNVDIVNVLDIASVEEGLFHVLYACALHPPVCCKLAESNFEFWSMLPLIQALLPALRPPVSSLDRVDESFGQWKHPSIEHALSQIVLMSSSTYHPLLHACAGYLSSYSSLHTKTACVLIDLCASLFSPWISTITAKVDLAIELMEDLLGIIQGPHQSIHRSRIALKYILLGLSGQVDDILAKYKEHKHKLLFIIEMLEPFLDPAVLSMNNSKLSGDVSIIFLEKQDNNCFFALNIIRAAVRRPTVLPSLESEWRRGSVASSVLLSILGPNMPLPFDIDRFKCSTAEVVDSGLFKGPSSSSSVSPNVHISKFSNCSDVDGKVDGADTIKLDVLEESGFLFAPQGLKNTPLMNFSKHYTGGSRGNEDKNIENWTLMDNFKLEGGFFCDYLNMKVDYLKLANLDDCELRAAEFQQLGLDLCSQGDVTAEGYDAAIDAFILAAECYINPYFMLSVTPNSKLSEHLNFIKSLMNQSNSIMKLKKDFLKTATDLEIISHLERKRDKTVIEILVQAASVNKEHILRQSKSCPDDIVHRQQDLNILPLDLKAVDAVTLLRQNQSLLLEFVIQQLQREQHLLHDVLLQALLFLLQSATELLCPPEAVVDIILFSAENLSLLLMSLYSKVEKEPSHFDLEKLHGLHRRWLLLERLVIASSGSNNDLMSRNVTYGQKKTQYRSLIPLSSWINMISKFSNASPICRFLGWMAVSCYAKQFLKGHMFFASDLSQLTSLLTVFADELAFVDNTLQLKVEESTHFKQSEAFAHLQAESQCTHSNTSEQRDSFHLLYPSLHKFFPNMSRQFRTFGERILEAVGLQLKCLPSSSTPEILRWFSDLCICPYSVAIKIQDLTTASSFDCLKGYTATNAKGVVLYLLESLVTVHMKSMLPEMTRVARILISLCKTSYCDVAFLDSVLRLLRPLISFSLKRLNLDEKLLADAASSKDFELLNFEELFDSIKNKRDLQDGSGEDKFQGSLMIFILGTLFPDLSLKRKIDILQSLLLWVGFTSEQTTSFYNYLCAFKKVFDSCEMLLEQQLEQYGFLLPYEGLHLVGPRETVSLQGKADLSSPFSDNGDQRVTEQPAHEFNSSDTLADLPDLEIHYISNEEMKEFLEVLEALVLKLIPEIEKSWKLHHKLANQLTVKIARCFLLCSCLKFVCISGFITNYCNGGSLSDHDLPDIWKNGLQGFTKAILAIQENECWQTTSAMLDFLFRLPQTISLDHGLCNICSAIKFFCLRAPMISWRLQTDKWLTYLFVRGMGNIDALDDSLVDLFSTMLSHAEPEQRAVALHHLGVMVGLDTYDGAAMLSCKFRSNLCGSEPATSLPESFISTLVSNTWDRVAALVLSEPSMILRLHAMALLSGYVPFVMRPQLQSFFISASNILQCMGKLTPLMEEGHLTRLSLRLLANACLYSPAEDIALLPETIWRNMEQIGTSRTGWLDDAEKNVCLALCRLQTELVGGKVALKEALSATSTTRLGDANFQSVRESIFEVLPSLASTRAYFDFFSERADRESQELEEAEIEIDLLQKDKAMQEVLGNLKEDYITYDKDDNRLQQIKDNIQSLERSKLKEEVAARLQKKLVMRHARQKFLEEVALKEMKLLEELDRERKQELEQEIERQRQLEHERARTRELQFELDMERERQSQRELQRELELVESGVRSSWRDFSSNSSSRPREKFRERDNVRSGLEGLRPASRGHETVSSVQTAGSSFNASSTPSMVLSGSRSFSNQPPTILQPRDRPVERSNATFEDNLEGSRDSGDANSIGDPELSLAIDGLAGGFSSTSRRGSKSRQIMERREREGRREGKWERKHG
ncbi:uncharacterized protein LOC110036913 isoform X2 [Phalaenopsis equestris]|uniref:uncharacterized protein LOC110036913 isoform X2 n=1 Tax=Phalaenopsis equestris TaxID=78828 RepID=UPI0009E62065|nr:uncharacterized protein LOC110036913 isoform X2 [Phalaenopsis equestris]